MLVGEAINISSRYTKTFLIRIYELLEYLASVFKPKWRNYSCFIDGVFTHGLAPKSLKFGRGYRSRSIMLFN
uniref:Uncharacterized protein n=1 Tax=Lepeophtheirus salmonis TaxID=72036 RepID=A0A0K2UEV7_LEPSM